MCNQLFAVAGQHVDDRDFNHGVASRALLHGSTGHVDQHLSRQCRVVDVHVEFEQLVLRLAGNAFAGQVHAVSHVFQVVDAGHLHHVGLVTGKVGVGLDGC